MREGILFGKLVPFLKRRIFFERILEREIEHWYSQKISYETIFFVERAQRPQECRALKRMAILCVERNFYSMSAKNSALDFVCPMRSIRVSAASSTFEPAIARRRNDDASSSFADSSSSSRRVPDAERFMAGHILSSATFLSSTIPCCRYP